MANSYNNTRLNSGSWSNIQLESGDAATEYQPNALYTIPLTDGTGPLTVYGGILNVTAGELTVTHGHIASYDGAESVPDGWMSSTGELSAGAEIVYPLAQPVTHTLTPVQIAALSGSNRVAANAGSVAVTYQADAALTLGGG